MDDGPSAVPGDDAGYGIIFAPAPSLGPVPTFGGMGQAVSDLIPSWWTLIIIAVVALIIVKEV